MCWEPSYILTLEINFSLIRRKYPGNHIDKSSFASTIGADHRDYTFLLPETKRNLSERSYTAKILAQTSNIKESTIPSGFLIGVVTIKQRDV
jgi:hypothetical protein